MNHFNISIIKSILRILACILAFMLTLLSYAKASILVLSLCLLIAELLGILEEVFDKRKE